MKNTVGVHVPVVLMPKDGIDMSKWSVVACDQYTSQPEYWDEVENIVNKAPSTLHLIYPEVHLEKEDREERISRINATMNHYLADGILRPHKPGFVYTDRKTSHFPSRKGLILAVDLEEYEYKKGAQTLIRATEGTVIERLPPRIKIRENAAIELPHIMLLIDDEDETVIKPLANITDRLEKLYDFELMKDGGHIQGYKVEDEAVVNSIITALEELARPEAFQKKYGLGDDHKVLLFAVGDGNHSLAAAKAFWENTKQGLSEEEKIAHPARYALVEVINVHDAGLQFEPIHRVVFNVEPESLIEQMLQYYNNLHCHAHCEAFESLAAMRLSLEEISKEGSTQVIPFITEKCAGYLVIQCPQYQLEVATLQDFLDHYTSANTASRIDYIHGDSVVESLGIQPGNIGFFLPAMDKRDLFRTVLLDGSLPRKTFSMGEAEEKRYYLESRQIR